VENALAYNSTVTITAVKSFIVQALEDGNATDTIGRCFKTFLRIQRNKLERLSPQPFYHSLKYAIYPQKGTSNKLLASPLK
jgi:hypothetical protein